MFTDVFEKSAAFFFFLMIKALSFSLLVPVL